MLLEDLFKRDNVDCPEWLRLPFPIEDDWVDSAYSIEGNTHKWTLKDIMRHLEFRFDGDSCILIAFHDDFEYMLTQIYEDEIIQY